MATAWALAACLIRFLITYCLHFQSLFAAGCAFTLHAGLISCLRVQLLLLKKQSNKRLLTRKNVINHAILDEFSVGKEAVGAKWRLPTLQPVHFNKRCQRPSHFEKLSGC